jgi:hypothetical protein
MHRRWDVGTCSLLSVTNFRMARVKSMLATYDAANWFVGFTFKLNIACLRPGDFPHLSRVLSIGTHLAK